VSITTLLPVLEGVLLSFSGWTFGSTQKKPTSKNIIEKIRNADLSSLQLPLQKECVMYRDTLAIFLERWVYQNTSTADFSLSFLNRHFILHGMAPEPFYRPADAHRLILLFDLIIEFLSMLENKLIMFIPDNDISLNFRRMYYELLIKGNLTIEQCIYFEREFLKQHIKYHPPEYEPSWGESEMNSMLDFMQIMSKITKLGNPKY
jgi:hypothetical protein